MTTSAIIRTALTKDNGMAIVLILAALSGSIFCFPPSYLLQSNLVVGVLIMPFTLLITANDQRNNRWLVIAAVVFGAVALTTNLRIAYFFLLSCVLLWIVECFMGRVNVLALFLLVFMSPVFSQVATILGFPIRLKLSALAGYLLKAVGVGAQVEGNTIILNGAIFSVDEACMGLSMISLSLLMATFLLCFRYRTSAKELTRLQLAGFFMLVLMLNVITNLLRIIALVMFNIPPEAAMHEIVGLICFACYTVAPLYLISAWLVERGRPITREISAQVSPSSGRKLFAVAMVLSVIAIGIIVGSRRLEIDNKNALLSAQEEASFDTYGVRKISKDDALIYIKSIADWFTSEHTPLYCWKGSGYVFSGIKEVNVAGRKIYCGKILKGEESLFTAWWYSDGEAQTISQLKWRSDMLFGAAEYYLVNVTARNEELLTREVSKILETGDKHLAAGQ